MEMRRKDRLETDPDSIASFIEECDCARLGFNDDGEVYIVPLNYGYEHVDGSYRLYFHGAKEGRKIGLIATAPEVGFEMDARHSLVPGDTACRFAYCSIIGTGRVSFVEDPAEKVHGLELLMLHHTGKAWTITEEMARAVCVFRLDVHSMSAKERVMPVMGAK